MPTGTRSDGLPASVTLLAPAGRDGLTASLAAAIHRRTGLSLGATGWTQPAAVEAAPTAQDDGMIDLVVVGAHLSGMPLNGQLRTLGARFGRATRTADCYRLHALAGTVPPKPGLVRTEPGRGAEIEVEVWRLEPAAFGRFVDMIPAPLGIGTIALADGTSAKGFLAEAVALSGARDITAYGGWRNYIQATAA